MNGYTFRGSNSAVFNLPEGSSGGAIVPPPASVLASALESVKFLRLSFLRDGQGADKLAVLSSDRFCFLFDSITIGITSLKKEFAPLGENSFL